MSNRTLIEINHDFGFRMDNPDIARLLGRSVRSNDAQDWEKLEYFGIRKIVTRHHSDKATITLPYATIKL